MKTIQCPHCGANIEADESFLSAHCRFCGATLTLSPEDLGIDKTTSELLAEMFGGEAAGAFLKHKIEDMNREEYWKHHAETMSFSSRGSTVEISYIHKAVSDKAVILMGKANVFILFQNKSDADRYISAVNSLSYPQSDTRDLKRFMPDISHSFILDDSRVLVIINRGIREYPLSSFNKLPGVHAAWIISRLENLCCLFQYNNLAVPDFCINDLYIDPEEHQVYFYGGLWNAVRAAGASSSALIRQELLSLRKTAANVMGYPNPAGCKPEIPEDFYTFLTAEPKKDAFADFGWWDLSLTMAYGKRKFQKLGLNDSSLN